jgi:Na+/proline symporter
MSSVNNSLSTLDLVLLIAYALISVIIGFWSSRKQKDEDYMIAGRKMGLPGFIASVVASYVGGAAIVAYTAFVYELGISAITLFLGTATGFLLFIPYAMKLRKISNKKKFHTLSDWFYHNFDKKSGLLSASILFIVYFGMLLNQFIAGSSILAGISGWSYESALMFSSLIITIYLFMGGFKSVIRTDIFQYIVLLLLLIIFTFVFTGDHDAETIKLLDLSDAKPLMSVIFFAFGILIVFQSAEYWQRVYAAKDEKVVRRGLRGSAILVLITGVVLSMIGLAAHYRSPGIESSSAFAEGMSHLISAKYSGAALVLIFAAIMSSADTIIFVLASSLAKDFSMQIKNKGFEAHKLKINTRIYILIFSVLGFSFAWFFRDIIEVFKFITGIGFSILPATIASFHMKLNSKAVFISLLSGVVYIIIIVVAGILIEELAIASFLVSGISLYIAQQIYKRN